MLIAETIKEINARKATGERIAEIFADALASTNPAFDRERFTEACK